MNRPLLVLLSLLLATTASARRRSVSPDSCSVTLSQQTAIVPAAGGRLTVAVSVSGGCAWVPTVAETWLTATPSGGTLTIDIQPNAATTPRTALVHIRGSVVIINQAGADALPNLVTNGGFTSAINGWSNEYSTGTGSAVWAAPGVAQITATQPPRGFQLHQCVNVQPSRRYTMGVKAFVAATEADGNAVFGVYEYRRPDCPVTILAPDTRREDFRSTPRGEWFEMTKTFTTGTSIQSFLIVIGAGGSTNPSFQALFDDVYVREQ
jgi:hypothetical protein